MAEPGEEPSGSASQIGRYSGYGITLAVAVALFAWLGNLLDERIGTSPLFVLLGTAAGFGGGLYRMLRELSPPKEKDGAKDDGTGG